MDLDTDSVPARLLRLWRETSGRVSTWLGVPPAGPTALPFQLAVDVAERTPLSSLLPYVDYDDEYELFILDNGRQLRAGFRCLCSCLSENQPENQPWCLRFFPKLCPRTFQSGRQLPCACTASS